MTSYRLGTRAPIRDLDPLAVNIGGMFSRQSNAERNERKTHNSTGFLVSLVLRMVGRGRAFAAVGHGVRDGDVG
jgi:hypothetical protein